MGYFGAMLDMSRNGVMKAEKVKEYADYLAAFGYNALMLYTEDTYEVDGEPYFGYLRGRYTKEEFKEIDAHCREKGIELIPCIQTLAHLGHLFRWRHYKPICDCNDILLAGDEKTYDLIDAMFSTLEQCFTSRKIHIGMDEAHMVGLGRYLDRNGFRNRFDILNEHLGRVVEIAKKHGFSPLMFSDMFFSLANHDVYSTPDPVHIPAEVAEKVPKEVTLVYWDYYPTERKQYRNMFEGHRQFSNPTWFAGGIWTWMGFAPINSYTRATMVPAMEECRAQGIENIYMTLWGDNGTECSYFSVLPALYYVKRVYDGERDMATIKAEFKQITGEDFDRFWKLSLPNEICGNRDTSHNPCKYALYNDPFLGSVDANLPAGGAEEYARHARTLRRASKGSAYGYLFRTQAALCDLLAVKYDLGIRLRTAYKAHDREALAALVPVIRTAIRRTEKFHAVYRAQWEIECKPHGFDVQDLRLGGLKQRLISCLDRLERYLAGELADIPELDEIILDFDGKGEETEKKFLSHQWWSHISASNDV